MTPPLQKRMLPLLYIGLGLVVALAIGVLAILLASVEDWSRDLTTNYAATSDEAHDERLRPIHSELSVEVQEVHVIAVAEKLPRWKLADRRQEGASVVLHFIRTTPLFRFQDDVHVRIEPTGAGSTVTAESQSRVGKGDLGQNPRNLRELLAAVRAALE